MYDPNTAPPPPPGRTHWGAGAIALLVIGLLILIPSGLCTGILGIGAIVTSFINPNAAGGALASLPMILFVGGIPAAIGGFLVFAGFRMRKRG